MVRLIVTPEITDSDSWGKTSKLLNSILSFNSAKILYAPTSNAQITAKELQERVSQLAETIGLIRTTNTYIKEEEFLSKGPEEITKYLESEADTEARNYFSYYRDKTCELVTSNLILVLEQEMSNILPNHIWKNMLKAEYGEMPNLKEGQGFFFNFRRNLAQGPNNIYSSYSCTPLF